MTENHSRKLDEKVKQLVAYCSASGIEILVSGEHVTPKELDDICDRIVKQLDRIEAKLDLQAENTLKCRVSEFMQEDQKL